MGKQWKQWLTLFFWLWNHCRWWLKPWNEKTLSPWKESYDQPRQHIKKQRHYFAKKVHLLKAVFFPVVTYGCESWTVKKVAKELMLLNCDVGEDCWESLGLQGDPTVHPKGVQSWVFIGRTDVEVEIPILWPPHAKSWFIGKDPDAGKDWGQEKKGTTENEMAGWHHWLDGHDFGWTPGVGDGQGGLACCDLQGHRVRHDWATELNWTSKCSMHTVPQSLPRPCSRPPLTHASSHTHKGKKITPNWKWDFIATD